LGTILNNNTDEILLMVSSQQSDFYISDMISIYATTKKEQENIGLH